MANKLVMNLFTRSIRRHVLIAASLLLIGLSATSALGILREANAKQTQYNGPAISGIFSSAADFLSDPTMAGIGTITMSSCTDGTNLGDGNIRMNCDSTNLPHNELSIAVDPSNPNHIVAGSNDYEIFFQGSSVVERIIAGYYTSFDGGSTWINGHISPDGFTANGDPAIAFDIKHGLVYYGTVNFNFGQGGGFATPTVLVATSSDGGHTFGHPVVVALGTGGTRVTVFNDKPYITVDNNPTSPFYGRLYVTYTRFLLGQSGSYLQSPIYMAFSDDGGQTFSTPEQISGSSSTLCSQPAVPANAGICNEDQFSSPVVGPDGTLYVAFENEEHAQAPGQFRNQYLVVSSTNGGQSFGPPVSAVFPIFDGTNDYPINVDGRQTLSNSQFRVNSAGNLALDQSSGPGISSTRLYIVFSDNRNGGLTGSFQTVTTNTDVFVVASSDGGSTWTSPVQVPGGAGTQNDQFYPWIAVDNTGIVRVTFMDRSYDPANIEYGITLASSFDHGATFTSIRVTTGSGTSNLSNPNDSRWFSGSTGGKATFIGDYNGLAISSNGVSHPAWTDMRVNAFPTPPPGRGHNTEDADTASI